MINLARLLSALLLSFVFYSGLALAGPYKVNCKAKLWRSDTGTVAVRELAPVSEDATRIIRQAKIGDILFELQENKLVFFFKPFINFPTGQTISTSGYFDQTGAIHLTSTLLTAEGVEEKADIRCCRDCTFSDWPAT